MDKNAVLTAIRSALRAEFEALDNASQESRQAAGDAESRSDGKYDTQSTEANYLADGQARQAATVAEAVKAFESLEIRDFSEGEAIDLGALVELRMLGERQWFFVGPASGGLEVRVSGEEVTVITPEAPLGGKLMGSGAGDCTAAPDAEILAVW